MNLFNDGPKAEAITVVLVEADAPTLQRDDVSKSSRSKIQSSVGLTEINRPHRTA